MKQPTLFDLGEKTSEFMEYHKANPQIWEAFQRKTFEAIRRGFGHYGARAIIELIRWETGVAADGEDGFKVNNNWPPYYGRMFERTYPEHTGFFRRREAKADEDAAFQEVQ